MSTFWVATAATCVRASSGVRGVSTGPADVDARASERRRLLLVARREDRRLFAAEAEHRRHAVRGVDARDHPAH